MYIIAGLGNPGQEYAGTRHNIGFSAVTTLADRYDIAVSERKHKALIGKGVIAGQKVILAQPQTYMNASGESLRALAQYYKIDVSRELIVVYDDIDLAVGRLRIRARGSAGGHNGVKSIIAQLGTEAFTRVRIGVGEKPAGTDLVKHVLGRFPREEESLVRDALKRAAEACETILSDGVDTAMNRFN